MCFVSQWLTKPNHLRDTRYLLQVKLLVRDLRNPEIYIHVAKYPTMSLILASMKRNPYSFSNIQEWVTILFSWFNKFHSFFIDLAASFFTFLVIMVERSLRNQTSFSKITVTVIRLIYHPCGLYLSRNYFFICAITVQRWRSSTIPSLLEDFRKSIISFTSTLSERLLPCCSSGVV